MAHRQERCRSQNTAVFNKLLRAVSRFVACLTVCFIAPGFIASASGQTIETGQKTETTQHAQVSVMPERSGIQCSELHPSESGCGLYSIADDKPQESDFQPLFDGKSFKGWNGDEKVFRIEDGAIVGGQLKERIPHNFFLATDADFADFELRLEFRLKGADTNAGIQIRSERIPDHHEMIGYQADLGQNYWGCLYDESRRNRVLASPKAEELAAVLKTDDWNSYRIVCKGPQIQLWINDLQTVDFTEEDPAIVQKGKIAVQIHGGPAGEAWYRNIRIRKL